MLSFLFQTFHFLSLNVLFGENSGCSKEHISSKYKDNTALLSKACSKRKKRVAKSEKMKVALSICLS